MLRMDSPKKSEPSTLYAKASLVLLGALGGAAAAWLLLKRKDEGQRIARVTPSGRSRAAPRRCAGMCKLKAGMYEQYTTLHDHTWAEVMRRMYAANMRNFVVYLHEESSTMFHHWEYIGEPQNFDADMASVSADPIVRKWWTYCEPCQVPAKWDGPPPSAGGDGGEGSEWWAELKCLNHCGAWPTAWSNECPDPSFVANNKRGARSTFVAPGPLQHNRTSEVTAGLAAELAEFEHAM